MDVIVAGGVQNHDANSHFFSAMTAAEPMGFEDPFSGSTGWWQEWRGTAYAIQTAQMIADKWHLSRKDLEIFSGVHTRIGKPLAEGRFKREILPAGWRRK